MTGLRPANKMTLKLIEAVRTRDPLSVSKFIAAGAELNGIDTHGNTALHYAVGTNELEIAKCLIIAGADVSLRNNLGETALDLLKGDASAQMESLLALSFEAKHKENTSTFQDRLGQSKLNPYNSK